MEHNRKTKVITMVALIVAVLGLSVGLSAYSKTLNIQNVQASVAGNSSNFNVVFSTSSTSASTGTVTGSKSAGAPSGSGSATLANGTTISNVTANFESSGGSIQYAFYAYNNGSIPAYLTGITFGGKTCTGDSGTNNDLVQIACDNVSVSVRVGQQEYKSTTKITDSTALAPRGSEFVVVSVSDTAYNHPVDGNFTVKFGDITLTYSSQKPSA